MKSLSEIRAWVEFQQSARHAGIESFVYMLGLIDRLAKLLQERAGYHHETCKTEYDEACDCGVAEEDATRTTLLKELEQ